MDFESINNKKIVNGKLRMTEPYILFSDGISTIAKHVVKEDEVGRIDIISRRYFNGDLPSEIILKYNNISNPFSINEGDVILIPEYGPSLKKWNTIKEIDDINIEIDNIRGQFLDTKRLSKPDAARVEYLQRKAAQLKNGSKQILPPNVLKSGEENLNIRDGKITI
jgi:hypothetical protein